MKSEWFKWTTRMLPRKVVISPEDMNNHIFICGMTGSGKTTTMYRILQKFKDYPFLIIEPSTAQYRYLLNLNEFKLITDANAPKNLKVFTLGDRLSPIAFNPFYIQYGVRYDEHLNRLNSIFKMALSSYPPMDQIINICLPRIYTKRGWDQREGVHTALKTKKDYLKPEHKYYFPTINDLIEEVELEIKRSKHAGEMKANIEGALETRLKSMQSGPIGRLFNTYDFYSFDQLFSENAILEIHFGAGSEDLALAMYVFLILANEYLIKNRLPNSRLKHFTVIEEAHNLIDNDIQKGSIGEFKANPKGAVTKEVEKMLKEWRKYGEGMCVIEQSPTEISEGVIENANTKIVHKLDSPKAGKLMAEYLKFLNLTISHFLVNGARSISTLKKGEFWIIKADDNFPTKDKTDDSSLKSIEAKKISDDDLRKHMLSTESKMQNAMYYLSSNTSNKAELDELARKFIFTVSIYGNSVLADAIKRYKHAIKQSLAYLKYTEEELNHYLMQIMCEQLVKLGEVIPDKFIENIILLFDTNMQTNASTCDIELPLLDSAQAYIHVRGNIKNVTDEQKTIKELEKYIFPINQDAVSEIAQKIIKGE